MLDFFATAKRRSGNLTVEFAKEIQLKFTLLDKVNFLDWIVSGVVENSETGLDHVNWLNHEKMSKHLKDSGFRTIYKSAFAQSRYAPMREVPLFDGRLPSMSFYIEAVK